MEQIGRQTYLRVMAMVLTTHTSRVSGTKTCTSFCVSLMTNVRAVADKKVLVMLYKDPRDLVVYDMRQSEVVKRTISARWKGQICLVTMRANSGVNGGLVLVPTVCVYCVSSQPPSSHPRLSQASHSTSAKIHTRGYSLSSLLLCMITTRFGQAR